MDQMLKANLSTHKCAGKPIYECSAVLRLDTRALTSQPGAHLVVVYPGALTEYHVERARATTYRQRERERESVCE